MSSDRETSTAGLRYPSAVGADTAPLCKCGSGLTSRACCEWDVRAFTSDPGLASARKAADTVERRAIAANSRSDVPQALTLTLESLERDPGRVQSLKMLYEIRKSQGLLIAAEALIRRLIVHDPSNFWTINELVLLLLGRGAGTEAARFARNGVRIGPGNAQAHYLMALSMTEMNQPFDAEYHYSRALELSRRRDPSLLANYALCLRKQGNLKDARPLYREALQKSPGAIQILMGLAQLEEADGQLDAALALLDEVAGLAPELPGPLLLLAAISIRRSNLGEANHLLNCLAARTTELGSRDLLEMGRLLDGVGRFSEAFHAFRAGKLKLGAATGLTYMDAEVRAELARLKGFFTKARLTSIPCATARPEIAQPIFIVGFPRSGTTLLEQILSAHRSISGGGELTFVQDLVRRLPRLIESPFPYPDALADMCISDRRDEVDGLRDAYLRKAARRGLLREGGAWFTDKMPLNEMHLGLVSILFPASPIIYLQRHPLDAVLSAYSHLMTHGVYCSYDLNATAVHYVRIADLVAHYRRELTMRICTIRYEDLVDRHEEVVIDLQNFIDVKLDPNCLRFNENPRRVTTASYAQVAEKLYDRARYRYRNYLRELEPIIPILKPTMDRLGYVV